MDSSNAFFLLEIGHSPTQTNTSLSEHTRGGLAPVKDLASPHWPHDGTRTPSPPSPPSSGKGERSGGRGAWEVNAVQRWRWSGSVQGNEHQWPQSVSPSRGESIIAFPCLLRFPLSAESKEQLRGEVTDRESHCKVERTRWRPLHSPLPSMRSARSARTYPRTYPLLRELTRVLASRSPLPVLLSAQRG